MPLDLRERMMMSPIWRRPSAGPVAGLSGCVLWLTADQKTYQDAALTTPATGTDDVGGWIDRVAGGTTKTLRQATGSAKPNLASVGGKTALEFTAAGSQQLIGGSTGATGDGANPICAFGAGPVTLAVAFRTPASIAAVHGILSEIGNPPVEGDFVVRLNNSSPTNGLVFSRAVGATPTYRNARTGNDAVAADTNYVAVFRYDGSGDATGDFSIRVNGVEAISDSTTTSLSGASAQKLFVGSYRGAANFLTGHIFGIAAYRAHLTGANLTALETYMGTLI